MLRLVLGRVEDLNAAPLWDDPAVSAVLEVKRALVRSWDVGDHVHCRSGADAWAQWPLGCVDEAAEVGLQ